MSLLENDDHLIHLAVRGFFSPTSSNPANSLPHSGESDVPSPVRATFSPMFHHNLTAHFFKKSPLAFSFMYGNCLFCYYWKYCASAHSFSGCLSQSLIRDVCFLYQRWKIRRESKTECKDFAEQEEETHRCSRETWFSWRSWFTRLALGCQVKKTRRRKKDTMEKNWWGRAVRETAWVPLYVPICQHDTVLCLFSASDSHASDWKWLTGSPLGPKSPSGPGGPRGPCKKKTLVPCIQIGWMTLIVSSGQTGSQMLNISISAKPSFLEWAASLHHYSKHVLTERWRHLFLLLPLLYSYYYYYTIYSCLYQIFFFLKFWLVPNMAKAVDISASE